MPLKQKIPNFIYSQTKNHFDPENLYYKVFFTTI